MSTTGISLTATSHALEMVTGSANQVNWQVSATDHTSSSDTEVSDANTLSSATTTTIIAAPAASTQRIVHSITVVCVGASNTITIQKDVSGSNFILCGPVSLVAGERIEFTQDRGFRVFTTTGAERNQAAVRTINVSAGASSVALSNLTFSNANGVSFGLSTGASAGTITASVAAAAVPELRHWNNFSPEPITTVTHTANSMWLFPLPSDRVFDGNMTVETLRLGVIGSISVTSAFSSTWRLGLYTLVNSTQLSLLNSVSQTFGVSGNASNSNQFVNGNRFVTIASSQWSVQPVLSQTQYWMGVIVNTSSHSGSGAFQAALVGRTLVSGLFGVSSSATQKYYPFFGAVNTSVFPASIAASAVANNNNYGQAVPAVQFLNGLATV